MSTGPILASMPAAMVGADTTGGVVIRWPAAGTDPDCIAVIAPSDSECAPAAAISPRHHPGRKRLPNRRRRYALSEGRRRRPAGHGATGGPVAMTGGP